MIGWRRRLAMTLVLASMTASAEVPQVTMIGLGAGLSCREWLAEWQDDEGVEQWVFGYSSALAATLQVRRGGDPLGAINAVRLHAMLAAHCREHSHETLSLAIVRMMLAPAH